MRIRDGSSDLFSSDLMAARIVVNDRHAVASLGQRHSRTEPHDTGADDIDTHNDPLLQCDIVYRIRYLGSRAGFHMAIGWKGVVQIGRATCREGGWRYV